mgnify:CR=1 FL=1
MIDNVRPQHLRRFSPSPSRLPALAQVAVPAPGASPRVDAIKKAGVLRVRRARQCAVAGREHDRRSGRRMERPGVGARERIREAPQREARSGARQPRDEGAGAGVEPGRHLGDAARGNARSAEGGRLRHLLQHQRLHVRPRSPIPSSRNAKSVDDLNQPDITIAYYTGGGEEGWVKERFPKAQLRGVAGSGVAPVEEVMAKRADAVPINRVPWVAMGRKLTALAVLPKDNNCQNSTEKAAPVGMAIDKNQPAFLALGARGREGARGEAQGRRGARSSTR